VRTFYFPLRLIISALILFWFDPVLSQKSTAMKEASQDLLRFKKFTYVDQQ
jgi:hypothetical protein